MNDNNISMHASELTPVLQKSTNCGSDEKKEVGLQLNGDIIPIIILMNFLELLLSKYYEKITFIFFCFNIRISSFFTY